MFLGITHLRKKGRDNNMDGLPKHNPFLPPDKQDADEVASEYDPQPELEEDYIPEFDEEEE